jgi:hypothetical protein
MACFEPDSFLVEEHLSRSGKPAARRCGLGPDRSARMDAVGPGGRPSPRVDAVGGGASAGASGEPNALTARLAGRSTETPLRWAREDGGT